MANTPTDDPTEDTADAGEIDVRNNRESQAAAANTATRVARASDGGAPPRPAPSAGEMPADLEGGTASGSPVAGVTISPDSRAEAVEPDAGQTEQEGPPAGHA